MTRRSSMDRRKALVREAYDAIAETWARERDAVNDARERSWLERFCSALPGARVVDLSFDGVIAYDSLWHLPREDHGPVLARIRQWVTEEAPLLLSVGALHP